MTAPRHVRWPLGAKLSLIGVPFLFLGLLVTTLTLWVSWQLDGGAAAVNEAGRMRMQVYRMAWLSERGDAPALHAQMRLFDASLALLRDGDPERPLVMPWDDQVRARMAAVERGWASYRSQWSPADDGAAPPAPANPAATLALIGQVETLVAAVEAHLSRFTTLTHLLQIGLLVSGVIGTAVFVIAGYRFVLEPVGALAKAIGEVREGDLGVRVAVTSRDEFGALAEGFNDMAGQLQASYQHLEARVDEKTALLNDQRERLQTLYEVSTLVTHTATLPELAAGFTRQVRRALRADGAALRLADEGTERFVLLAADGLPEALADEEHCIRHGDCHCGIAPAQQGARVIDIRPGGGDDDEGDRLPCHGCGWAVVVTVPIRLKDRLLGELDLFFHARHAVGEAERTLLDALTGHLAIGLDNLRVAALEKEAAVAEERGFLARELHDSIAQSLAFLKIQVTLMRDALERGDRDAMAAVLSEIDLGVRESHGDVRELLMHFRTRTNAEDIEPALRTTLRKFEHQTGIPAELAMHGQGLPLPPDVQVQALHIVQEALSNVRKHAGAQRVWVTAWRQPVWRFEVRDDGRGFDPDAPGFAETHVGLRIMAERAQRLGADFSVVSAPGAGTRVVLVLPADTAVAAPAREDQPAVPTLS